MLVEVGRFLFAYEAYILRSRLVAEGLFATVVHDQHPQVAWHFALALGGVKVLALEEELDRVREVLARGKRGDFTRELEAAFGDLDDLRCPVCGSREHVDTRSPVDVIMAIAALLVAFVSPYGRTAISVKPAGRGGGATMGRSPCRRDALAVRARGP